MSFADEIAKLRRRARVYFRFSGLDNPAVSGSIGGTTPNLYAEAADNSGTYPIQGTVQRFGSFQRALTNYDQGFEIPTISTELIDKDNQWRRWASRPWTLVNRFGYYVLRIQGDDGIWYDEEIAHGQITDPSFPPGRASLRVEMLPGDYLGEKVPRRLTTLDDWPKADSGALGQAVKIIYGKMDNTIGDVEGFEGTTLGPSGAPITGFQGVPTTGGNPQGDAPGGSSPWYAVAPVDGSGKVTAPPAIIGPIATDGTNNAVALTWDAYVPTPSGIRVWRGNDASFGQYDLYRDVHPYLPDDLDGAATSLTDTHVGLDNRSGFATDTHWDVTFRHTIYYWVSAVTAGGEQPAVGPVVLSLQPMNLDVIRAMSLTWEATDGAIGYVLRRARSVYHYEYGFDREWQLSAATTSHVDWLNDTTPVNIPENFAKRRAGAVECLYVNTNPEGQAGEYTYLVAGHGCYWVREVFVTKSTVTPAGNKAGSLDRPKGVSVTADTTGSTIWRYKVSAYNSVGETLASNEVSVSDGAATPDNTISWEAVVDATGYHVYRAGETGDFERIASESGVSYNDNNAPTQTGTYEPEANTSGTAYASGQEASPAQPILQTLGVDYTVSAVTINGNRYQIIKFAASQEGNPVTCNVWGIENVGDSTGNVNDTTGVLIERPVQQFKHFLLNWVFNNSRGTQPWFSDTGYQAGLLDLDSFDIADAAISARIPGGYRGAGALTEQVDIRQAITDWLITCDLDWFFWNRRFEVKVFDPTSIGDRSALTQYTQQDTILEGTFQCYLDVSKMANAIPWQAGPQYDGYFLAGTQEDLPSQAPEKYGRRIESQVITLWWSRHRATCVDVIERRLRMVKNPPVRAVYGTPLRALQDKIATSIAVTHEDGLSALSTGWTQRVCKILRSNIDFDRRVLFLEVQDLEFLLASLGYVYYGSRAFAAADQVYTTATADKKETYAYLASRATGLFSDGTVGKRLGGR